MITPTWNATVGGTAKVAFNLVTGIRNLSPTSRIHVITSDKHSDMSDGITYTGEGMISKLLTTIKALARFRPEVIHCQGRIHHLLISYFYKILFDGDVKLICSFYTQPSGQPYLRQAVFAAARGPLAWLKKQIGVFLLNRADWIVANSASLAGNLRSSLGGRLVNTIVVIPSGVEPYEIDEEPPGDFIERWSLQDAYPVFCTVGVLQWDWKVAGMLILLKALRGVIEQWPSARLILVGDGQYRSLIEQEIEELGLQRHVVMTGNVSNTFIPLAVADIYCHMAHNESCSVSILEAMISGKPIIASRAGGNSELIDNGETGILVEPEVASLRAAMLELARNRESATRLGKAAAIIAGERFNWNVIAREYMRLYLDQAPAEGLLT